MALLKGWMGNEIGKPPQFGQGGLKAMKRLMESGPGRFLPHGSDLADTFRPSTYGEVFKDGWGAAKTLWHEAPGVAAQVRTRAAHVIADPAAALRLHSPAGGLDGLARAGGHALQDTFLSPEVAQSMRHSQQLVQGIDNAVVRGFDRTLGTQLTFNATQWSGFTTIDVLDKRGVFDALPDAGIDGLGLVGGRHGFTSAP